MFDRPLQSGSVNLGQRQSTNLGGLGTLSGLGGLGGLKGGADPNTPEGLLELARMQGGAVAAAAEELVHPEKGILSTVSDKFKNGFKNFVELISVPNQIVAGIISPDYTVPEAIRKNIATSDVIFGESKRDMSTMQKAGSIVVRFATDMLLDPTTYLTFGTSQGIMGLRSATKITLGEKAAKQVGKEALEAGAVNDLGKELYGYLKTMERSRLGRNVTPDISKLSGEAKEIAEIGAEELDKLMKNTADSLLDMDYAKKAISNMLEVKPQLAETILDKGGIKYFGRTILEAQRISRVFDAIPGFNWVDKATQQFRRGLMAPFSKKIMKADGRYIRTPEEFVSSETAAKDMARFLADERVTKLGDIVEQFGLTDPEGKLLMADIEAGKMPADERLAGAYKALLNFNDEEAQFLKKFGKNFSVLDNHAPHVFTKLKVQNSANILPAKTTVGAAKERKLKGTIFKTDEESLARFEKAVLSKDQKLIDETVAELKNAGMEIFDDNIFTAHFQRSIQNTKDIVSRQFINSVAETFGEVASLNRTGWRKLNSQSLNKEIAPIFDNLLADGEEVVFHPAIAERIEKFVGAVINDEPIKDVLRYYDSITNFWKGSVTSIWPAFHGRNALSNVLLNFNDIGYHSLNPAVHSMAIQLQHMNKRFIELSSEVLTNPAKQEELTQLLNKKVFTDTHGYDWTFGELRAEISSKNIAFGKNITGSLDFDEPIRSAKRVLSPSRAEKLKDKGVLEGGLNVFQSGRNLGSAIENQARLVNFIANLKGTGDVGLAAERTKMFLFDYQSLTPFEKQIMRRIFPFYTFTRKNLEAQVRTLLTTPGRTITQIKAFDTLGDVLSGGQLSEEERNALPDWLKSGMGVLKKKEGSIAEILVGFNTPIEQPFQQLQANVLLGSVNPIARTLVEQMSGYSFFQGKPFTETINASAFKRAPKALQDFIGYTEIKGVKNGKEFTTYVSLRPDRMNLVMNSPFSRLFTTLKQIEQEGVSTQSKILQQTLGFRTEAVDLEVEAQKREDELKTELQRLLKAARVTAEFKRIYVPK